MLDFCIQNSKFYIQLPRGVKTNIAPIAKLMTIRSSEIFTPPEFNLDLICMNMNAVKRMMHYSVHTTMMQRYKLSARGGFALSNTLL